MRNLPLFSEDEMALNKRQLRKERVERIATTYLAGIGEHLIHSMHPISAMTDNAIALAEMLVDKLDSRYETGAGEPLQK